MSNATITSLEKKVFVYPSSEADKLYFKRQIIEFTGIYPKHKTFTEFLYKIVWDRNDEGRTTKYMYHNDRQQRVFLDRTFYDWAVKYISLVEKELEKAYGKRVRS